MKNLTETEWILIKTQGKRWWDVKYKKGCMVDKVLI